MPTIIELERGKYTIVIDAKRGVYKVLRYGNDWRDITGDKLIMALIDKLQEAQRVPAD